MNVVSVVSATLVLARNLSAPRQEIAAAIRPTPLSQLSTEGTIFRSATRINAPTILRDAATTHNVDTATLSAQSWPSEAVKSTDAKTAASLHEQLALSLSEKER